MDYWHAKSVLNAGVDCIQNGRIAAILDFYVNKRILYLCEYLLVFLVLKRHLVGGIYTSTSRC